MKISIFICIYFFHSNVISRSRIVKWTNTVYKYYACSLCECSFLPSLHLVECVNRHQSSSVHKSHIDLFNFISILFVVCLRDAAQHKLAAPHTNTFSRLHIFRLCHVWIGILFSLVHSFFRFNYCIYCVCLFVHCF